MCIKGRGKPIALRKCSTNIGHQMGNFNMTLMIKSWNFSQPLKIDLDFGKKYDCQPIMIHNRW